MSCFDNFISLEELCNDGSQQASFYLNQIGINKTEIEQVITKEYPTTKAFVNSKVNFAIEKVVNEVYNYLSPKFKANSILAGARIGQPQKTQELITQTGQVGVQIQVKNPGSFLDFVISDISLYTDFTGTIDVNLYDLDQDKLLATVSVDTIAGEVSAANFSKIVVASPRQNLNLWLGYDSLGTINSYKTTVHNGCSDCSGHVFNHRFVRANGASVVGQFLDGNVTVQSDTAGIAINYSVNCNHRDWLCTHRNILGIPTLYKAGIEICNHAILSAPNQRSMSTTTVNSDLMERKLAYFESEYAREMGNILRNMAVPSDQNCFNCEQRIVSRTTLA